MGGNKQALAMLRLEVLRQGGYHPLVFDAYLSIMLEDMTLAGITPGDIGTSWEELQTLCRTQHLTAR